MDSSFVAFTVIFVVFIGLPGIYFIYRGVRAIASGKEVIIISKSFKLQEPTTLSGSAAKWSGIFSIIVGGVLLLCFAISFIAWILSN